MDLQNVSQEVEIRELIDRSMARLNTCIPGSIVAFFPDKQTVTVAPAVKMKTFIDGVIAYVDLPQILEVPIVFPFASVAGFALTIPIQPGDPCLLVFSQRSIDNWHERGGVQPPEDGPGTRHHDLTDAFAIIAPSPLPSTLSAWEASGIELRNRAKGSRVTVRNGEIEIQCGTALIKVSSGGSVEITAPGGATVTAPLTSIIGNLQVSGTAAVTGALSSATSVSDPMGSMNGMRSTYNTHTHPENGEGGGTTSQPNQQMT